MLRMENDLPAIVAQGVIQSDLRSHAETLGFKSLRRMGLEAALHGDTTLEEVLRET